MARQHSAPAADEVQSVCDGDPAGVQMPLSLTFKTPGETWGYCERGPCCGKGVRPQAVPHGLPASPSEGKLTSPRG